MVALRLGIRNAFRQKRRTTLMAAALAVGVLVMTLLESFTSGMTASLAEKVVRLQGGDLFVTGTAASPAGTPITLLRDPGEVVRIVDELDIEYTGIARRSRSQVRLVLGSREVDLNLEGLSAQGEDLGGIDLVTGARDLPEAGGLVLLPEAAATRLDAASGDRIIVKLYTATGQQNLGTLTVAGTFRQELAIGQSSAYADIEDVNDLLGLPAGGAQTIAFRLTRPDGQDAAKSVLVQALTDRGLSEASPSGPAGAAPTGVGMGMGMGSGSGMSGLMGRLTGGSGMMGGTSGVRRTQNLGPDYVDLRVTNVNDATSQLSDLADTLRLISVGLFVVLVFIALMGLSSAFRMAMIERTAEMGTLRALGALRGRVLSLFLIEALLVTAIGIAAGTILGLAAIPLLSQVRIAETGPLVLFLRAGRMVFRPDGLRIGLNAAVLLAAGALAVLPQAWRASRCDPAAAIGRTA